MADGFTTRGMPIEKRIQVLSELSNRAALIARLGKQYGTSRDLYEALGYKSQLTYDDYDTQYHRQDIAKAIINRPVQATWRGLLTLQESTEADETEFEKAWVDMEKKLSLKNKFARLDKLSAIGTYGVMLLGFDDVRNQESWSNPVSARGRRELIYVKPLGAGSAKIANYVKQTRDPRYGLVQSYNVEYQNPGESTTTTKMNVHHSRVIHVVHEQLESEIEGVPVLESVFNRLMDLEKLVGGSAEMFWRGARPGYQGRVKDDYTMTPAVEDELQDQLDEFEHNLRRILVNEGIELEALMPQVSDPSKHVDVQIQMISAVTGIPKRILMGTERGELASTQDEAGWLGMIKGRREEHAEVNILRPFVDRCIEYGALPKPSTGDYQVRWEDLFAISDKDRAEVGRIRSTALKEYTQNVSAEVVVPPKAFFRYFLGLTDDEIENVQELRDSEIDEEMELIKKVHEGTMPPNDGNGGKNAQQGAPTGGNGQGTRQDAENV